MRYTSRYPRRGNQQTAVGIRAEPPWADIFYSGHLPEWGLT